jgi:hypothetical protein
MHGGFRGGGKGGGTSSLGLLPGIGMDKLELKDIPGFEENRLEPPGGIILGTAWGDSLYVGGKAMMGAVGPLETVPS